MLVSKKAIENEDELLFAVFSVESTAQRLGVAGAQVHDAFSGLGEIMQSYIIPCYDSLHTQSKEYIVDNLLEVMAHRGVIV